MRSFACPSLTTIHQDIFQRGTIAAEYLFKMIDGWNPKTTNLSLPVRLVVRDSVKLLNPLKMIPPMTVQLYKALRDICRRISRSDEPGAICIIYEDCYEKIAIIHRYKRTKIQVHIIPDLFFFVTVHSVLSNLFFCYISITRN
ncbi:MAG: substrate-binding domain-containing protein [Blautia wexlerae]